MTVSGTATKYVYTADGSNVYFPFSFKTLEDSDIQVWVTNLALVTTQIFTNFDIDDLNGRVIYPNVASGLPPITSGFLITLVRVLPLTQLVDLVNQGVSSLSTLEEAYDRLTLITQQLQEQLNRSVQYPIHEDPTNPTPAELLDLINEAIVLCNEAIGLIGVSTQVTVGSQTFCTYPTLAAALSSVTAGTKILVVSDLTIAASVTISLANIAIEFLPGVTITDSGAAGTGLILAASGIRIKGCRFSGFGTNAIQINNGSQNNFISENRFSSSCVGYVLDNNTLPNSAIFGNVEE